MNITTIQTTDQPTVLLPVGHSMTLPLIEGGYTARVVCADGNDYTVRIGALPWDLTLFAADVRA